MNGRVRRFASRSIALLRHIPIPSIATAEIRPARVNRVTRILGGIDLKLLFWADRTVLTLAPTREVFVAKASDDIAMSLILFTPVVNLLLGAFGVKLHI